MIAALIEGLLDILFILAGARIALCILFLTLAVYAYLTGAETAAAICLALNLIFATWIFLKPPKSWMKD